MKPAGIGIIGCGNVLGAYRAAIDRLRLPGLVEVVFLCGRESQREASAAFPGARFTVDAAELIASPRVELVIILTSMAGHAPLARAALESGKHVLLEKPLATSLEEAAGLVSLAKRSPGILLCAPFTCLSPTFQTLARRIRAGDIGKVCSARARYGWSGPWWSEWFYKPGGGCLLDLGIYCVTTLTGLIGPARRVMAMTGVAIPERDIGGRQVRVEAEDNAQVLLDFGEGAFGAITTGFTLQQYRSPAVEVYGSSGTIQMLGDDWDPDGHELWQNSAGSWQVFRETDPDWSWTDGLRHMVERMRSGERPWISAEHSFHVLEVLLKARQSSAEGRAICIESTFPPPVLGTRQPAGAAHRVHDRTREHE